MSATAGPDSSGGDASAVDARVWAVSKGDANADAYEDAAHVRAEAWPVRAAVADGATESAFAGAWAERLACGVVEEDATTPEALRRAVPAWQAAWRDAVRERAAGRPWYVEAKAEEGAFATLLGLSLRAGGQWRAVGVGDCCLFRVRDECGAGPSTRARPSRIVPPSSPAVRVKRRPRPRPPRGSGARAIPLCWPPTPSPPGS